MSGGLASAAAVTRVYVDADKAGVGARLGAFVAAESARAIADHGRFVVAISGGSLPKILAAGLFSDAGADGGGSGGLADTVAWDKWHIFFADERVVPLDHDDSNFKGCDSVLFANAAAGMTRRDGGDDTRAKAFRGQIHTITMGTPEEAAVAYRSEIESVGGKFDLVLLGMGPDGHTASLFPGHPLLDEYAVTVASIANSPKPPPNRITLTYPVINAAASVAFVAAGGSKADNLPKVLSPGAAVTISRGAGAAAAAADEQKMLAGSAPEAPLLPAARVQPASGNLHWFVDAAAAAQLVYGGGSGL
jgi:6-phosphogluconolactonase